MKLYPSQHQCSSCKGKFIRFAEFAIGSEFIEMIFENFEFAGLEEGNGVGELEVGGGVWRGRRQFLPAGGAYDVEADKLKGDGAAG